MNNKYVYMILKITIIVWVVFWALGFFVVFVEEKDIGSLVLDLVIALIFCGLPMLALQRMKKSAISNGIIDAKKITPEKIVLRNRIKKGAAVATSALILIKFVSITNNLQSLPENNSPALQVDATVESESEADAESIENMPPIVVAQSDITESAPEPNLEQTYKEAFITAVTDGDTITATIDGESYKARLIGVDTPETVHPNKPVEEYGKESSEYTKSTLLNKTVYLQQDVSETDKYGRLLCYVWLTRPSSDNPSCDEVRQHMYNAQLVKNGYAQASSYPPDVKYSELFGIIGGEARTARVGLWADPAQEETVVAKSKKVATEQKTYPAPTTGGKIKGNISSKGKKIYHSPGQRDYEKTKIDTSIGERYFDTAADAEAAGWRAAKR